MFHCVFFDIFEAQSKRRQLRGILSAQCTHCALARRWNGNVPLLKSNSDVVTEVCANESLMPGCKSEPGFFGPGDEIVEGLPAWKGWPDQGIIVRYISQITLNN